MACGVVANLPTASAGAFRGIGFAVGIAAAAATVAAIDVISVPDGSPVADQLNFGHYLSLTTVGFYAAVGGFVLIAFGSLIGARRAR